MRLDYFKYFKEVATKASFTKAANSLHISQQSLSEYIKRIEDHYEIKLFQRKPSLHLTTAGELLLEYIANITAHEDALLAEFSQLRTMQKGKIRLGITPTRAPIFFPDIFAEFNKLHPNIDLSLREDHTTRLVKDLTNGAIDFIIGLEDNNLGSAIVSKTILADNQLYFFVAKDLLAAKGFTPEAIEQATQHGVTLADIKEVPVALKVKTSRVHGQIITEYSKMNARPKVVIESSNIFPLLPLCNSGSTGLFVSGTNYQYIKKHYDNVVKNVIVLPIHGISINCSTALMYFNGKDSVVHFKDFINTVKSVASTLQNV